MQRFLGPVYRWRPSTTRRCRSSSHGTRVRDRATPADVDHRRMEPERHPDTSTRLHSRQKQEERRQNSDYSRQKKERRGCVLLGPKPSVERRAAHILCSASDTYEWLDLSQLQRQVVLLDFRGSCSTKTGSLHFP